MDDEEHIMPIRQGSIDQLCGVYSVMNATELVIGKFHYDRQLKRKASQRKTLFSDLIGHLAKHGMLETVLTSGIEQIDENGLINIAVKSVKKYQKLKLRKQIVFDSCEVTIDQFWEKLTQHLDQPSTAAIINISGRIQHWTCVRQITPDTMILSDSSGIRRIAKSQCSIGEGSRDRYILWPTLTYLLSVVQK